MLPATTDATVFMMRPPSVLVFSTPGACEQVPLVSGGSPARPGTPIGQAEIVGSEVHFSNGDKLVGLHPHTAQLEVSRYSVMGRFFEARAQHPLTAQFAQQVRTVAASIKVILDKRKACDELLE